MSGRFFPNPGLAIALSLSCLAVWPGNVEIALAGDPQPAAYGVLPQPELPSPASAFGPSYAAVNAAPSTQEYRFEDWTMVVSPVPPVTPYSGPKSYDAVYRSIPYRRLEYMANPSYRHDATMEILFGQMRPTVVNRTDHAQRIVNPIPSLTQPYPISKGELWSLPWAYYTPWFSQWPIRPALP